MDTHTAQTRSGEMAYVDEGEGRTALFVHGVATSSRLWHPLVEEFRGERRCVAIDLPLHGATPPRADYTLPALAEAIEDFCAALDLHDVDLVANDTGGAIAQVFAARHPERLRTFTLTNCDTHDNLPPEEFRPTVERPSAASSRRWRRRWCRTSRRRARSSARATSTPSDSTRPRCAPSSNRSSALPTGHGTSSASSPRSWLRT